MENDMGLNMTIHTTKMPLNEVVEFCKKWNNYHDENGEWNEDEMYVDYDEEMDKKFTELTDWRAGPVYQVHDWLVEHVENNSDHGGLFIITREHIENLSIVVNKIISDLAETLEPNHNIQDYLIDGYIWNRDKPNFSNAFCHHHFLFVQKDIKKILDLLNSDDDINLVYHGA